MLSTRFVTNCRSSFVQFSLRHVRMTSTLMSAGLKETDPVIFGLIEKEKLRQKNGLVLIPSENFTSPAVLEALGSVMQNKYSEGYPGARYYGGNENIDAVERLCQERALTAFHLDPERWGVNVQSLSGSPANFQVYTAVLKPHDRLFALDLPHGGHLSHGYQTPTKKISAVSTYFECLPYRLDEKTGRIDYDEMERIAAIFRPKLLISGASAYPRHFDFARLRKIADQNNSLFMFDMAHISGLISARVVGSPFDTADIVTTTTHKTLRGPRGAMIFYRKGVRKTLKSGKEIMYDLEDKIKSAVFPGHQGGPHNHTITALAVALLQAHTPEFRAYQESVLKNARSLSYYLMAKGYDLVSGGTDTHLMLVDLRPKNIDGARVERVMELCGISVNKNTVPGDKSALVPGGIRIGSPALTSRGLDMKHFEQVGSYVDRAIKLTVDVQTQSKSTTFKEFKDYLNKNDVPEVNELRSEVEQFLEQFPAIC